MPIYYTSADKAKALAKGHRYEQDFEFFCTSDQEHKLLPQFSYAHGQVVGLEELPNSEGETEYFAILFDPQSQAVSKQQYASSRFPAIGCYAQIDAPPEVLEQYQQVRSSQQSQRLQSMRNAFVLELTEKGVEPRIASRFFDRSLTLGDTLTQACSSLLITKQFRSEFRRSLRDQLVRWIDEDSPRYPSPFSSKQIDCLMRFGR